MDTAGYNGFAAWLWLEANLRDPILSNLKVRQAIAHAVNKQALVKTVWNGYAEPFVSPVPSLVKPYHNPNVQPVSYTHLDVYKRQGLCWKALASRSPAFSAALGSW